MLSYFSHVQLFATPWTIACQAPLSMGLSRQEYCSDQEYKLQKTLKINFSSFFTNYIKHLKHLGTLNITFREYILMLPIMKFS